jgi:hypothetical protein
VVKDEDLFTIYKYVYNHFDLTIIPYKALKSTCQFLNFNFTLYNPRLRLIQWTNWILKDDHLLKNCKALHSFELIEALDERGIFIFIVGMKLMVNIGKNDQMKLLKSHVEFTQGLKDVASRYRSSRGKDCELDINDEVAMGTLMILRLLTR